MAENEWVTVLHTIYQEDIIWTVEDDYDETHPVVEETDLDPGLSKINSHSSPRPG